MEQSVEIFERHRDRLFRLAYGMTGRATVAEDIVQESFIRWRKVDLETVRSPGSYLSTVVTNLSLDEINSARHRRERYIGPDLPEPVVRSRENPPDQTTELAESLTMAMLVVLKKLSPVQRAVFLLREVFDYDYGTIAGVVEKSEAACRKIAQRARESVRERRPKFEPKKEKQKQLLESMMLAIRKGELEQLENLLARDAIHYSDGGGKVSAARKPIEGAEHIARFLIGISQNAPEDMATEFRTVNYRPGIVIYYGGKVQSIWSFRIENNKIRESYAVLNPDKLKHLVSELS